MKKTFKAKNQQLRFFHKWSNKGYSVYNSIKVAVKICTIPVTYSLVSSPLESIAQTDSVTVSKKLELKELVVSSDQKAESYSELNRVVLVITQKEIQQLSASSLQDVLEKVVNVDIRQRGVQGVQADMSFRGGSFDQVLVLLNGVNITDPQTGHHNLNIPIDLNSIQRIEVLQGPGARVYGPGAFSGAINIITQPDSNNQANVSVGAGEHGFFNGNIRGTINKKNSSTFLSVSNNRSNGYIDNTDYNISNIFIHSKLSLKPGNFSFFSGYQLKSFGANSFYTPKYPNQFEKTSSLISSLEYEKKWNQNTITINGYLRKHWDRFELFRDAPPVWYKNHNYHLTTVGGAKAFYKTITKVGRTQFGAEFRSEGIISNVLGDTLSKPVKVRGVDSTYYIKGDTRYISTLFADHTFYINRFNISAGLNYSYSSMFSSQWSYGLDVSYELADGIRLYSSVNRSYRNPTFTDLYYIGPTNIGNSNLKPESAFTYEAGLKSNISIISGYIGYFHRDGNDIIDWIKMPQELKWQPTNYTSLKTDGLEISTTSKVEEMIPFIKSASFGYSHYWQTKNSGNYDSYYALDFLKQNIHFGINHSIVSKLSAVWDISWQQREGEYLNFSKGVNDSYKPFWLVDLKLNWISNSYTIYASASNLFDVKYIEIANIEQPGRWITIGFNYKFHL